MSRSANKAGVAMRMRCGVGLGLALATCLVKTAVADVRYVDASAAGPQDGLSWATAYTDLQAALADASGNPAIDEIWIAAGVYRPTQTGDRDATFELQSGLIVRGGFAGDETSSAQRRPALFQTILSGDIGAIGVSHDNSYHVVSASGVDATGVLEACIITDGNADGTGSRNKGGGLVVRFLGSDVTVVNCSFLNNSASFRGGGVYQETGSPTFANCVFSGNSAGDSGGGIHTDKGDVRLVNCVFSGNDAGVAGGGVFTTDYTGPDCPENVDLVNSILWGNTVGGGAGSEAQLGLDTFRCAPELRLVEPVPFRMTHSCLQDWDGVLGGPTNFGDDPQFLDADGPDGQFGTLDDDLHIATGSPCANQGSNGAVPADTPDLDGDGNQVEPIPYDRDHNPRIDGIAVEVGAYELALDCNNNGVNDAFDIAAGTSADCNDNALPDECELDTRDCNDNGQLDFCEVAAGSAADCNANQVLDQCDISAATSEDCDFNGVPDECELPTGDCNVNGVLDTCDILGGASVDCDLNSVPDECELPTGDCNANGVLDVCDLAAGTSADCNNTGVPDACELESNDCNANGVPDECESDCNNNGTPDTCEAFTDCNTNAVPDECDLASGHSPDFDGNGVPDECDPDCNNNGFPDFVDIAFGLSPDCDGNGVPDECHAFRPGDLDYDGDVDLADAPQFLACYTGARCEPTPCADPVYTEPCCIGADGDADGDVDLVDFALLQAEFDIE